MTCNAAVEHSYSHAREEYVCLGLARGERHKTPSHYMQSAGIASYSCKKLTEY
jgi:hypothetical protein